MAPWERLCQVGDGMGMSLLTLIWKWGSLWIGALISKKIYSFFTSHQLCVAWSSFFFQEETEMKVNHWTCHVSLNFSSWKRDRGRGGRTLSPKTEDFILSSISIHFRLKCSRMFLVLEFLRLESWGDSISKCEMASVLLSFRQFLSKVKEGI